MNLNRSVLVAVMMMASVVGAGCKRQGREGTDQTPVEQEDPAAAATTDDAKVAVQGEITIPAPPALLEETPPAAPSEHHVWSPGYWHYDYVKTVYAWEPGYWQDRLVAAPMAPPPMREEVVEYRYAPAGDFFWAPGYWRWTGTSYSWAPGYWAPRMEGWGYVRPYWVSYGGRWECHGWGWERRTAGWGWDRADWSRRGFSASDRIAWERDNRAGWANRSGNAWDRREHDHRVNPATASRPAPLPRAAEMNHAMVAAHAPAAQPSMPRTVEPSHGTEPRPAPHAGVSPRPEPPHVNPGAPQGHSAPQLHGAPVTVHPAVASRTMPEVHVPAQPAHASAPAAARAPAAHAPASHASAPASHAGGSGSSHRRS